MGLGRAEPERARSAVAKGVLEAAARGEVTAVVLLDTWAHASLEALGNHPPSGEPRRLVI